MPPNDQIFMGAATAVLCGVGLANSQWILENTQKGERLNRWLGVTRGLWVVRGLFGFGLLFGVLLATNIVRPIQW